MSIETKDREYLGRDARIPLEITKSEGSYLFSKNKRYIDFMMGWCVGNTGWNNKAVVDQMNSFDGPTYVNPYYLYKRWVDLAELLAKITPGNLKKSFRATGGTEAVEIALQAAMSHTKREKFVSIEGSYHGHSIGAMSVGDSFFREKYTNLLPGCHKIKPPLNADAGREVEKILKKGDVAAFISEPIICNLGVLIPDDEFFGTVSDACKTYGTLLIMDEVATGFGRTGKLFASEHYSLKPDIMTLAKGLTGGYGSLGATIMTDEVAESFEWNFSYYSTFGWLPLAVEGTIANIEHILQKELWKNAQKMGEYFKDRLGAMKFKHAPRIRAKGLAIGVEFEREGYATEIAFKALENGLLVSDLASAILLFPALNIDKNTADEGLAILERSL
jgi:acetylornithine/succinyldiaminopimelate/putrescine aminotransferase